MKKALIALLTAVLALLFATGLGLAAIHISDEPYVSDIEKLGIVQSSGFSREEILENYNAVMSFLSPFSNEPFSLPGMSYTQAGASHFADCKPIFNAIYLTGLIAAVLLLLLYRARLLSKPVLRLSGTLTLAIPVLLGLGIATGFEQLFVTFHKVFFSNDDWLFDPATDEIINILPEEFFLHCAVFIGAFWLVAAVTQLLVGKAEKED